MKSGLSKIRPDRRDYSLLHTFGGTTAGLPDSFRVYDGRAIPNQDMPDTRFTPALPALFYGCTGETATFDAGIQDNDLYNPQDTYLHTPPYSTDQGRDIRTVFATLINRGPYTALNTPGPLRRAYFNCYGSGAIDDFDAARIGLWINQNERRGVWVGSYWYPEFMSPVNGILPLPSFNTAQATLHCWLIVGWTTINGVAYLQGIPWIGENYGDKGIVYVSREIFNALMGQPYTAAYTITKVSSSAPVPIGVTAIIDHLVYFIKNLFHV